MSRPNGRITGGRGMPSILHQDKDESESDSSTFSDDAIDSEEIESFDDIMADIRQRNAERLGVDEDELDEMPLSDVKRRIAIYKNQP